MSAYAIVLLAYAQVAATLTGFIGVVFVFAERSRRLDDDLSSALFHLMYTSLSALFLSFLLRFCWYIRRAKSILHGKSPMRCLVSYTCLALVVWHLKR